jgi:hypothetical protein
LGRSGLRFIGGARVRERLRPGVLGGRAGTRGDVAAAAARGRVRVRGAGGYAGLSRSGAERGAGG